MLNFRTLATKTLLRKKNATHKNNLISLEPGSYFGGHKQSLMCHFWDRKVDFVLMWRSCDRTNRFICCTNSTMFVSACDHWCLLAHNFAAHAHAWHSRVLCRCLFASEHSPFASAENCVKSDTSNNNGLLNLLRAIGGSSPLNTYNTIRV